MKQHRLILTAMTFFALCTVAFTGKTMAQADGTEGNPFLVATVADLQKVGSGTDGWTLSAHYRQTADIDLSSLNWTPIGDNDNQFRGTYDGYGYSISNLTASHQTRDCVGLFGYTSGVVIRNVALLNAFVRGKEYVGGIVGRNGNSTVENCYVTGSIEGENTVGGIAGISYSSGIIQNCYTTCSVTASSMHAGGIAAVNSLNGKVQYCYATGIISAETGYPCGIVGQQGGNDNTGYQLTCCVALNTKVSEVSASGMASIGRITGTTIPATPSDVLSNNYGRNDMVLMRGGNPVTAVSDAADIHGADVTANNYEGANSGTWWSSTAGFSSEHWSFAAGRLPLLNVFSLITTASATVTAPVGGANAYSYDIISGDSSKYTVEVNSWYSGDTQMAIGDTFVAGEQYRVVVEFRRKTGYTFADTLATTINGIAGSKMFITASLALFEVTLTAAEVSHTITATAGANGTISPSGAVTVTEGEDQTFTLTANSGYRIDQVLIDGTNNPAAATAGSYTFENVTGNHTIDVSFKATTGISEVSANAISIYPNPTDGKLFIESGDLHMEKVEVLDITGRTVLTSHETEINISHLSAGTYFVKLKTDKGGVVKKVIKE